MQLLFVCLGNICRSPLAEAIFKQQIVLKGLEEHFIADSCGTADYEVGDPPDPRTIRNAIQNGVFIRHRARQFELTDFERFDLILAMDSHNQSALLRLPGAGRFESKIRLMRTFDEVDTGKDVPDPYHWPEADFQKVYIILERSVRGLIAHLEKLRLIDPGD